MSAPQLRVERTPLLGRTAHVVVIECAGRRTALGIAPETDRYMAEALPLLKASTIYRHESEHRGCNTEWLWWSEGLLGLRQQADAAWDAMVAEELRGLRN
jgi:hypothetical protein